MKKTRAKRRRVAGKRIVNNRLLKGLISKMAKRDMCESSDIVVEFLNHIERKEGAD